MSNWPYATTYEIFIQSYSDSNGDGIGDIPGLISKLDYIQNLGVKAIWLMPINPSPSYHKYDVTDYRGIHPDYGTIEDFTRLVEEAHKRDLKIVMDLVINHCSSLHPWFTQALKEDSIYRDYFVWATPEQIEAEGNLIKEATGDSDNIHQWNKVPGQDELYFSFFYSGMPDLNFDNPRLREEVYDIGRYWLEDIGVDGFRLDAAKHIFPDHRATDTHAFWKEFKSRMEAVKPDVYLVGEVWTDLAQQAPFAQGFTALFNFDMAFSILETVKNEQIVSASIYKDAWKVEPDSSLINLYLASEQAFHAYNPAFINTTFLTNHDQNRVMSFLDNDPAKARLAANILFTLPGSPYIYYGEELGVAGKKPDPNLREPMLWSAQRDSSEATWIKPKYAKRTLVDPVAVQENDPQSMLNHYKKLIDLRNTSNTLSSGSLKTYDVGDDQLLAFERQLGQEILLVIHNLSPTVKTIKKIPGTLLFSTDPAINEKRLNIPPFQTIILKTQ